MYCCWPFLLMWPSGNYCCADVSSYNATGQNNAVLICLVSGKGLWKQWWPHRQEGTLIDEGMLGGTVGLWLGYVQHKGGCLIRKEVKRQKAGNRLLKNEQLKSVFKRRNIVLGTGGRQRKERRNRFHESHSGLKCNILPCFTFCSTDRRWTQTCTVGKIHFDLNQVQICSPHFKPFKLLPNNNSHCSYFSS